MVGERSEFGNLFKPPSSLTVLMVEDPSDLTENEFTVAERVEIVKKIGKGSELNCPSESIPRIVERMDAIFKNYIEPEKDGCYAKLCKKIERCEVFCNESEESRVFYNGTEESRVF